MVKCKIWVLRVLDLADIIGLVVAEAISMKAYNQRKEYRIQNGYMVAEGQALSSCNLSEAYRYNNPETAKNNLDVINGFTIAPLILVIINLIIDFFLAAGKLFGKITDEQDQKITKLQLFLTFLFTPLCFPIADFEYAECIQTGLNDTIMEQLQTYSSIGFTMLACLGIIIALIIVVGVCLKDKKEDRQKLQKCLVGIAFIVVLIYAGIALMFLIFAFIGTLISLGTGILIGVGGIIEGYQLYCSYQECKEAGNKIGLGN